MASKTSTIKCGNCEYWTGKREPIFDRYDVPKNSIIDKIGNCEKEGSRFCGQSRKQGASCKCFSKWTELF